MRVTRLEVFGFKSFMERLVLPLDGGITAVVGPNGCGKSNIVDAIRWVLGETRARNLRGEVLEDVIFAGTDKLRPLGLAEVTITLRASGENFFADLQHAHDLEVELAEILESVAVPIEAQADEHEAEGAQEGRPRLTVIEGNLDKQHEAEAAEDPSAQQTESSSMPTLATRFGWLRSVSEVQVTRRLYRSGESEFFINRVPCRLRDLKELFRATGIGARANTVVAQGEVARVVSAKPEERRLILEEAAGVLGFREKIAASSRKLEETSQNIARLEDIVREVTRQVGILKRQAARAKNRQELKDQIREHDRILARDRVAHLKRAEEKQALELKSLQQSEANAEAVLQRLQAAEQEVRNEMMTLDIQGDALRLQVDSIRDELSNRARQHSDKRSRLSETQALMLSSQHQLDKLSSHKQVIELRRNDLAQGIAKLEAEESELAQRVSAAQGLSDQKLAEADATLAKLRQEEIQHGAKERALRDELVAAQSALELIDEELKSASALQAIDGAHAVQGDLLISLLSVPERYTKAAQAILAERAGFFVLEDPHALARSFSQGQLANDSHHSIGAVRAGDTPQITRRFNLDLPALIELIEVAPQARAAAHRIFGSVFVAESLAQALDAVQRAAGIPEAQQFGFAIVTLNGEILTQHTFQALRAEGGLLQLSSKAQTLRARVEELSATQALYVASDFELKARIAAQQEEQQRLSTEFHAGKEELAGLTSQLKGISAQLGSERRSLAQQQQDGEQVVQQIAELEARLVELKGAKEQIAQEIEHAAPQDEGDLKLEVERLTKEYQALDQQRKSHLDKLAGSASVMREAMQSLDQARAALSEKQLELQRIALDFENLKQRLEEEFDAHEREELLAVSAAEVSLEPARAAEMREEVAKLRGRMLREGDVDPTSIQRYDEEQARLDDLTRQRDDLTQAAATLKHTIERLTETSKQRFLEVFEAVAENFSKLVPRLFGGGRGSIHLIDAANPLDTGVEINVRPPGKKLKNIDLLSGGEKALAATALIFAMFMERPSPLCVLDEVDAPLDEANLLRFLNMIREMSARTQFLMITHNKQSMALADNLVGVTMQQPGASKVIMVSLNEAISQVA